MTFPQSYDFRWLFDGVLVFSTSLDGDSSNKHPRKMRGPSRTYNAPRGQYKAGDVRVNQQQVNSNGVRLVVNRPDHQMTFGNRFRVNVEYDGASFARGIPHAASSAANDPSSVNIIVNYP